VCVLLVRAFSGNYNLQFPILLPSSYDLTTNFLACNPLANRTNDEGDLLSSGIVIVSRGTCGYAVKAATIGAIGAQAMIVYNSAGGSAAAQVVRMTGDAAVTTPQIFISRADGLLISQYLTDRRNWLAAKVANPALPMPPGHDYNLGVMATVVGTGATQAGDLAAMQQLARTIKIGIIHNGGATSLRDWSDITTKNIDPCLQRVFGVWCERGRVQYIFLKSQALTGTLDPAIGDLTALEYLTIDENRPDSIGQYTR
jgi:hypothetical protein